jgi:hypothetical protein
MSTSEKQEFLKEQINKLDANFLDTIYDLTISHLGLQAKTFELTEEQKQELDKRSELYRTGKTQTFTWEEVKQNLGI